MRDALILNEFSDTLETLSADIDTLHDEGTGPRDPCLAKARERVIRSAKVLRQKIMDGELRDALSRQGMLSGERKDCLAKLAQAIDCMASVLRASIANGWGYRITSEDQSAPADIAREWNAHWHTVRHSAIALKSWASQMGENTKGLATVPGAADRVLPDSDALMKLASIRESVSVLHTKSVHNDSAHIAQTIRGELEDDQRAAVDVIKAVSDTSALAHLKAVCTGRNGPRHDWKRIVEQLHMTEVGLPDERSFSHGTIPVSGNAQTTTTLITVITADDFEPFKSREKRASKQADSAEAYLIDDVNTPRVLAHALRVFDAIIELLKAACGNAGHDTGSDSNQSEDDADYKPASWFSKSMASRLRMAALPKRKTKRVRKKKIDGVVCYSVTDARRWWGDEVRPVTK